MTNPNNKYFNEDLKDADFQDYLEKSMSGNMMTRSILCKAKDDKLTVSMKQIELF